MFGGLAGAVAHQGADDGGGHAEIGDPVVGDEAPHAVGPRIVGGALGHDDGAAEELGEHDGHGAGHPSQVAHPQKTVARPEIHAQAEIERQLGGETAVGVNGALGLAGGARREDQHEGIVGRHFLGRRRGRPAFREFVPPDVASRRPFHRVVRVLEHDHVFESGGGARRLIENRFHGDRLGAPAGAVDGDRRHRAGVVEAAGHGLGAEAGEQGLRDGADLGHREEGGRRLRHHRHEECYAVAASQAERPEALRQARRLRLQFAQRPGAPRPVLALIGNGLALVVVVGVEAIEDNVGGAADAPFGPRQALRGVHDARVGRVEADRGAFDDGVP